MTNGTATTTSAAETANRASLIAAITVGGGLVLTSLITFLAYNLGGGPVARIFATIVQDPIGFAFRRSSDPVTVALLVLAALVLVALTWLIVRAVVRAAAPGRGAAAFFGTWAAIILASIAAGALRMPSLLITEGYLPEQFASVIGQGQQIILASGGWGISWGWITAIVVAVIHRAAASRQPELSGEDRLR